MAGEDGYKPRSHIPTKTFAQIKAETGYKRPEWTPTPSTVPSESEELSMSKLEERVRKMQGTEIAQERDTYDAQTPSYLKWEQEKVRPIMAGQDPAFAAVKARPDPDGEFIALEQHKKELSNLLRHLRKPQAKRGALWDAHRMVMLSQSMPAMKGYGSKTVMQGTAMALDEVNDKLEILLERERKKKALSSRTSLGLRSPKTTPTKPPRPAMQQSTPLHPTKPRPAITHPSIKLPPLDTASDTELSTSFAATPTHQQYSPSATPSYTQSVSYTQPPRKPAVQRPVQFRRLVKLPAPKALEWEENWRERTGWGSRVHGDMDYITGVDVYAKRKRYRWIIPIAEF